MEIRTHIAHPGDVTNGKIALCGIADSVGPGGAPQAYSVHWPGAEQTRLYFAAQNELGMTNEILLAIVIDRLEKFQSGPYACTENAAAVKYLVSALDQLHLRTRSRATQGVEGKLVAHKKEATCVRDLGNAVAIGHVMFTADSLQRWDTWDIIITTVHALKRELRNEEWDILGKYAVAGGKNGFAEMKSVLKRIG